MVVGVEDISMVAETVGIAGEGLVYCSQPTNRRVMKMVIKIRLLTKPVRDLLNIVTLPG